MVEDMTAADKMLRMRHLMKRLPNARFAIDRAMARATSTTQRITDMPKGGGLGGDEGMVNAIDQITRAKMVYTRLKDELNDLRDWIDPEINAIEGKSKEDGKKIRETMRMRYISGMSILEISTEEAYCDRMVYRRLEAGEKEIIEKCQ